jgi:hypothetical protein
VIPVCVGVESSACEQRTVPVEKTASLKWIQLTKMNETAHASFCNASIRLENENDAGGAQIVKALKSDKFCARGDFDGDGDEGVATLFTLDEGRSRFATRECYGGAEKEAGASTATGAPMTGLSACKQLCRLVNYPSLSAWYTFEAVQTG